MNKFNEKTFEQLQTTTPNYRYSPSLETVFKVLHQRSDTARRDAVNHNCMLVTDQRPFTWTYRESQVITFPMYKASTGWYFYLDVEENGAIYLSEGKYTNRTLVDPQVLNWLRPSVKRQICAWLEALCCGTDGYGIVALCNSTCPNAVETKWHKLIKDYRTEQPKYKLYRHLECGDCSADFEVMDNYSDQLVINPDACIDGDINDDDRMVIAISELQHDEEDGDYRYVELIHNNSVWSQECLLNPGSIMFNRKENGEYEINRESFEDWKSYAGISTAITVMGVLHKYEKTLEHPEDTKLLGYHPRLVDGGCGGCFVNRWALLPDKVRPHVFIDYSSDEVHQQYTIDKPTLYYDDIADIRMYKYSLGEGFELKEALLNEMGQVTFKHSHRSDFDLHDADDED